jgi:hypothetical protein
MTKAATLNEATKKRSMQLFQLTTTSLAIKNVNDPQAKAVTNDCYKILMENARKTIAAVNDIDEDETTNEEVVIVAEPTDEEVVAVGAVGETIFDNGISIVGEPANEEAVTPTSI